VALNVQATTLLELAARSEEHGSGTMTTSRLSLSSSGKTFNVTFSNYGSGARAGDSRDFIPSASKEERARGILVITNLSGEMLLLSHVIQQTRQNGVKIILAHPVLEWQPSLDAPTQGKPAYPKTIRLRQDMFSIGSESRKEAKLNARNVGAPQRCAPVHVIWGAR